MSAAFAYYTEDSASFGASNDNTPHSSTTVIKLSTASRRGLKVNDGPLQWPSTVQIDSRDRFISGADHLRSMKRVKSTANGKVIYNVYDYGGKLVHVDEEMDGKETDYLHGMGLALARIKNGEFTYLHPDHLGSAQAGTNEAGVVSFTEHYTPFGVTFPRKSGPF